MKLMSMTDFVLAEMEKNAFDEEHVARIWNYARFLKTPLSLGQFVPCDLENNVLEEPNLKRYGEWPSIHYDEHVKQYNEARERVLFEGFEIHGLLDKSTRRLTSSDGLFSIAWHNNIQGWYLSKGCDKMTIEDLVKYDLTLTKSAITKLKL